METLFETIQKDGKYFGEHSEYLVAHQYHGDSELLGESNFKCFLEALGGENKDVVVAHFSHPICEFIKYILINPERKDLIEISEKCNKSLDGHPVLDEMHYSDLCETYIDIFIDNMSEGEKEGFETDEELYDYVKDIIY